MPVQFFTLPSGGELPGKLIFIWLNGLRSVHYSLSNYGWKSYTCCSWISFIYLMSAIYLIIQNLTHWPPPPSLPLPFSKLSGSLHFFHLFQTVQWYSGLKYTFFVTICTWDLMFLVPWDYNTETANRFVSFFTIVLVRYDLFSLSKEKDILLCLSRKYYIFFLSWTLQPTEHSSW